MADEQVPQATAQGVIILDAEQNIVSANGAFSRMSGYSRTEILAHHCRGLSGRFLGARFSECRFLQGPDTDLATLAAITAAFENGAEFCGEILNYRKSGARFWNELTIAPVRDAAGKLTHFISVSRDITERKQLEAKLASLVIERQQAQTELQKSEAELEQAFSASPIGMSLVALDGRFLRVNHAFCKMLGWSESELLARGFQAITYAQDISPDLQLVQEIIAGMRQSYQIEKRYFHKDGHQVWAQLNVSVVLDKDGAPQHFLTQIQDITEAKIAAEALRLSEQNLSMTLHCMGDGVIATDAGGFIIPILIQKRINYPRPMHDRLAALMV